MNPLKTMSGAVLFPVHTAATVAGRAIGLSIGATKTGVRTTGRLVEWVADRKLAAPQDAPGVPLHVPGRDAPATTVAPSTPEPPTITKPSISTQSSTTTTSASTTTAAKPKKSSTRKDESIPTPADVKPAIDRAAPLEAEPVGASDDSADDAQDEDQDELLTASGIPAAGVGINPATGQPNDYDPESEPLLDPSTVKSVRSETDVLRRAAEDKKG
jgi:hypothetical protein